MKIYTKTGDRGFTSLVNGVRIAKNDIRIEVYGTIDELSAHIGAARSMLDENDTKLVEALTRVQSDLFVIGSQFATPEGEMRISLPALEFESVVFLEQTIDFFSENLPELRNFILPGGSVVSAQLHVARTVCRRAERATVSLYKIEKYPEVYLMYLNRLSDFLFVAARWCNVKKGIFDEIWAQRK